MNNANNTNFKSGFISIIGRPNVGKSTLLNALIGSKVSIVSEIPQTTRFQVRGILNMENAQIVFVDTPGIHSFKKSFIQHLNTVAKKSIEGIEGILYVVDVSREPGDEEEDIMRFVASAGLPTIMAFNKIDTGGENEEDYRKLWQTVLKETQKPDPVKKYIRISALKGENLDELKEALLDLLPAGHPYYEKDTLTDFPLKFRISDIIREKLFYFLKKELPHSVAVEIETIEDRSENEKGLIYISAIIYVNRDSQKKIIIGKGGQLLKKVGSLAREELEQIFNKKVYLELFVKVVKDWQKSPRILRELGYWWT